MDLTQIKRKKRYYWFTLVELIIVITILAILATISFVSFSWYTKKWNDTKKLTNLQTIEKWLDLLSIQTWKYPNPDKQYWTWTLDWVNLNYVWYVWEDLSRLIKLDKAPIDNITNTNYVYWVSSDFKKFQIATTFEDYEANILIPKVYAGNLKTKVTWNYKYPLKIWDKLYSLPSLIFVWNVITNTWFIVDWWENNLFDKVNNKQTTTKILEKITWSWGLILTWVTIPKITNKEFRELKNLPNDFAKLWIKDKEYLWEIIYWDKYLAEKTSIWEKTLPELPKLTCPDWYILVPWDKTNTFKYSDWSSTNDFCVAKYEMKIKWNDDWTMTYNSSMIFESRYSWIPKVDISQKQAIEECNSLNTDWTNKYHLITNNEWMTISRDIENQDVNWSGWAVWQGWIYSGVWGAESLLYCTDWNSWEYAWISWHLDNPKLSYIRTQCSDKRQLKLSNWSIIHDFSWNLLEHVNKANTKDGLGYNEPINYSFCPLSSSNDYKEWKDCTNRDNYWPKWFYDSSNWIWKVFLLNWWSVFYRWGNYYEGEEPGLYSLKYNKEFSSYDIWFRCSYSL